MTKIMNKMATVLSFLRLFDCREPYILVTLFYNIDIGIVRQRQQFAIYSLLTLILTN